MAAEEQPAIKRRRRDGGRVRVTRACDFCKKKKLRCTGTQPCALCTQGKRDCTFVSEYNRGKVPGVCMKSTDLNVDSSPRVDANKGSPGSATTSQPPHATHSSNLDTSASRNHGPICSQNRGYENHLDQIPSRGLLHASHNEINSVTEAMMPDSQLQAPTHDIERSSRNSPEPAHIDQEGHYVGPASGVSFLSRALKKLRQTGQSVSKTQQTSMFNFADSPVPRYDPYFLILPNQVDAQALIRRYFDFASPTHRYLHQPTVERWCDEFYENVKSPNPVAPGGHEIRAILLAVFAVASQYSSPQDLASYDTVNGAAFFAASEHHLQLESGGIRLTGIQARLVQCFLLLSQSRVNSAWSLFGTIANLVLAIGLHRRHKRDANFETDLIERECRKRVFWSAHTLDSYLGVGLGRPRSFHGEDLDQDLPLCVDDWQITPTKVLPRLGTEQSLTKASIYHAKLLQIMSGILRDLYSLKRLSPEKQEEVTQSYDERLIAWRDDLDYFLGIKNTEMLIPLFRRQHTVLHLAYSQVVILLHRQALLVRPSQYVALPDSDTVLSGLKRSVQRCLDGATTIMKKLRELIEKQEMYSAFWFTHYYVFSALVALYLYVIQQRSQPAHTWKSYLDMAQQGLRDLSSCSTDTSYAQRYVVVLRELQDETMKLVEEESRSALTEEQILPQQPDAGLGNPSEIDLVLSTASIAPGARDQNVTSTDFHTFGLQVDGQSSQDSGLPCPSEAYDSMTEPWALNDPDDQEAFRNLNIEGLADLAFIFSAENTHVFQSEKT